VGFSDGLTYIPHISSLRDTTVPGAGCPSGPIYGTRHITTEMVLVQK